MNITYELVKLTGQALQKNAKYSRIAEISEIKFSKNYIRRFSHRHGIRQDSNKSNLLYKLMLKFVIQYWECIQNTLISSGFLYSFLPCFTPNKIDHLGHINVLSEKSRLFLKRSQYSNKRFLNSMKDMGLKKVLLNTFIRT